MLIELNDNDIKNLMVFLERTPTTGLSEAQVLLMIAQKLNTPAAIPNTDEFIDGRGLAPEQPMPL